MLFIIMLPLFHRLLWWFFGFHCLSSKSVRAMLLTDTWRCLPSLNLPLHHFEAQSTPIQIYYKLFLHRIKCFFNWCYLFAQGTANSAFIRVEISMQEISIVGEAVLCLSDSQKNGLRKFSPGSLNHSSIPLSVFI